MLPRCVPQRALPATYALSPGATPVPGALHFKESLLYHRSLPAEANGSRLSGWQVRLPGETLPVQWNPLCPRSGSMSDAA